MENENKTAAKNLGDAVTSLGAAMGKIFNDPLLKEKAGDLGKAITESAETLGNRFKDPEVKVKFKEAGDSVQAIGKNISDTFGKVENSCCGTKTTGYNPDNCNGCNGRGWVEIGAGISAKAHKCPVCGGTGKKTQ